MRLPPLDNRPGEWPQEVLHSWARLLARAQQLEGKAGSSDAFERMLAVFRDMVRTGRFDGFKPLLGKRLAARALTWLWLHDEVIGPRLLNTRLLNTLIEAQQPRLTRITMVQLVQLYFRQFDRLDEQDKNAEEGLRGVVEAHLHTQLNALPEPRTPSLRPDALTQLKQHGDWLLGIDGPLALARYVREQGSELGTTFESYGLAGLDSGRYGDICRAHFYLETLRGLAPGEWDEVLDELLKPSVSKAPYEGDKRIGHAALEILIDRAGEAPGDAWQNFILNLAGDPRIASSSPNYRQWWLPLGEARINQVRSWLSKEDLRLFLQAVEQYGNESGKEDLQRMFPARKTFLEGLFKLGLIRHTRLMLGRNAQQSVRKILGTEVKTNFAQMDSSMNDKAVIYLDCGDFHLVEGSHSFKIWVYLAQPGQAVKSYDRNTFSHFDLTIQLPKDYKKLHPSLGYEAVTHNGSWQRKVFDFLAGNGIAVDIEQLLGKKDYRDYLNRFGIPAVSVKEPGMSSAGHPERAAPAPFKTQSTPSISRHTSGSFGASVARLLEPSQAAEKSSDNSGIRTAERSRQIPERDTSAAPQQISADQQKNKPAQSPINTGANSRREMPDAAWELLAYFNQHPLSQMRDAAKATGLKISEADQVRAKYLGDYCQQGATKSGWPGWQINEAGKAVLQMHAQPRLHLEDSGQPLVQVAERVAASSASDLNESDTSALAGRIVRLPESAIAVLKYFASNPGDKARYASNVLDIEVREINRLMHGPLKAFCKQDASFGWRVSADATAVLNKFFP